MLENRLPNLICPGVQKSGTTTLFRVISQHPDIYMPPVKEQHFFDVDYDKGLDFYMEYYKEAGDEKYIPDFSP